jgi:hypothetical protein
MKRITPRIVAALLTFVIGVGAAAAIVRTHHTEPPHTTTPHDPPRTEPGAGPALELVFVLDTTGSMGGLIDGAKQRIWGIVNEVMQSPTRPAVRVGLVAYRDEGDEYVTQVLLLTSDLDRVYTTLMDYRAGGGGDRAENVRRALADGVSRAGWSQTSDQVAQILFLVGDAPPHDDYANDPDTLETTKLAVSRGMTVNTIQCGDAADTRHVWQQIAARGEGKYFAIAQDGGVQTISTPYDERLAELAARLGSTYTPYGGGTGTAGREYRAEMSARQGAAETKVATAAPIAAQAERAFNKALNRDAYAGDLLQSIENGTIKLAEAKPEELPDDLQKLAPAEREKEISRRLDERKKIREEIVSLSKKRDAFIAAERGKRTGGQAGFDAAVAAALKEQLAKKRIK